jgi:hypothetical protein
MRGRPTSSAAGQQRNVCVCGRSWGGLEVARTSSRRPAQHNNYDAMCVCDVRAMCVCVWTQLGLEVAEGTSSSDSAAEQL